MSPSFSKEVGVGKKKKRSQSSNVTSLFRSPRPPLSHLFSRAFPSSLFRSLPPLHGSPRRKWRRRAAAAACAASSSGRTRGRLLCRRIAVGVDVADHAPRRVNQFSLAAQLERHVLLGLCKVRHEGLQRRGAEQQGDDDGVRGQALGLVRGQESARSRLERRRRRR